MRQKAQSSGVEDVQRSQSHGLQFFPFLLFGTPGNSLEFSAKAICAVLLTGAWLEEVFGCCTDPSLVRSRVEAQSS